MKQELKSVYIAPSFAKIGDFETTTLSSTGGANLDAAGWAALGAGTIGDIIVGQGGLTDGLVS